MLFFSVLAFTDNLRTNDDYHFGSFKYTIEYLINTDDL